MQVIFTAVLWETEKDGHAEEKDGHAEEKEGHAKEKMWPLSMGWKCTGVQLAGCFTGSLLICPFHAGEKAAQN